MGSYYKGINLNIFLDDEPVRLDESHDDFKKVRNMFPREKGVDRRLLEITREGVYSMSNSLEAKITTKIIVDAIEKRDPHILIRDLTITDATANVGGNTLDFSKNFGKVEAVEYNKANFEALSTNIDVYDRSNVTLYHADYTKILNDITQDVVFIDPPWGAYYKQKKTMLYLGQTPVWKVVNLLEKKPWVVAIKVPKNFDFFTFKQNIVGTRTIYKTPVGKHFIVIVVFSPTAGFGLIRTLSRNMDKRYLGESISKCLDDIAERYGIDKTEVLQTLDSSSYFGLAKFINDVQIR